MTRLRGATFVVALYHWDVLERLHLCGHAP